MSNDLIPRNQPVSDGLHPAVYVTIVGLTVWLVLSALWGFADNRSTDYLLAVVSGFFFTIVAIPFLLWRVGRWKYINPANASERRPSFREWASGGFGTWQDQLKGASAAIQILLPIAAVAFGMTAFAIALHLAVPGAA